MELFHELLDKFDASVNMAIELGIVFDEIEYQSCVFFMEHSERTRENPNDIDRILDDLRDAFDKQLKHKVHDIVDICEANGINAYSIPRDVWHLIKIIIFERFASEVLIYLLPINQS